MILCNLPKLINQHERRSSDLLLMRIFIPLGLNPLTTLAPKQKLLQTSAPTEKPQPAPQPKPQPAPQPKPQPPPQPKPQPAPQPKPQPAPQPKPQPAPQPKPQTVPQPKPQLSPKPQPQPQPQPGQPQAPSQQSGIVVHGSPDPKSKFFCANNSQR